MRKDDLRRHLAALVILAVITLVMTYPLVLHLGSSARDPGDPLLNAWILAWDLEQLQTGNITGFFEANIFYRNRSAFPRGLVVELSTADGGWQIVADRQLDRLPIEAFLRPLEFPLLVEFEPTVTRFLRLTNTEPHDADPWLISEIRIW